MLLPASRLVSGQILFYVRRHEMMVGIGVGHKTGLSRESYVLGSQRATTRSRMGMAARIGNIKE
jgi:hypothetical protein